MFDRFTERARKTMTLARQEAQRWNHDYIGTEHLLLGLVAEGDGLAAEALGDLGVTHERVRAEVVRLLGSGTERPDLSDALRGPTSQLARGPSEAERRRIERLLRVPRPADLVPGSALALVAGAEGTRDAFRAAVAAAFDANGLRAELASGPFGQVTWVRTVTAAVVVADLTGHDVHVAYALGLCHGIGRDPILLARSEGDLPEHLRSLGFVPYDDSAAGIERLRTALAAEVARRLAERRD